MVFVELTAVLMYIVICFDWDIPAFIRYIVEKACIEDKEEQAGSILPACCACLVQSGCQVISKHSTKKVGRPR